ncbi:MAG: hypothetical protein ACPL1K_03605 [Candidatus Kryptoniota bacterium]
MVNEFIRHLLTAMLIGILSAGNAFGQISGNPVTVEVIPIQSLNFGNLIAGVKKHISYFDLTSSGQFEVRVTSGTSLFILGFIMSPVSLTGPQGAILPLSYTGSDGYYNLQPKVTGGTKFNPLVYSFFPEPGRKYYFYIGGTANPSQTQRSGAYSGLIMIQVVYI